MTKSHVSLVVCNYDPKPCNTQFIKYVFFFYSINVKGTIHSCKFVFNFFFFFCIKKSGDSTLLTQKERCPKKVPKSLF